MSTTYRKLLADLTAAGITIPAGVTTAKATLDTFAARQPQAPAANVVAASYRDGDTDAEVAAVAATADAYPAMLQGHQVALSRYDADLGDAIGAAESTLVAAIDTALAALTPAQTAQRANLTALRAQVVAA